jgi:hypothetical protein
MGTTNNNDNVTARPPMVSSPLKWLCILCTSACLSLPHLPAAPLIHPFADTSSHTPCASAHRGTRTPGGTAGSGRRRQGLQHGHHGRSAGSRRLVRDRP